MKYLVNRETKEHREYTGSMADHQLVGTLPDEWEVIEADPEGWIKHDGGVCPLPFCHKYDLKDRGGRVWLSLGRPETLCWSHSGDKMDVVDYRPILDDKPEMVKCKVGNRPDYYKPQPDDIISRLKSAHKAANDLPDIIAELREGLEPMGYDLVARDPFVESEPVEDMTDWRNWREGDILEVTSTYTSDARVDVKPGDLVTVLQGSNQIPYCKTKQGETWAFMSKILRFHSRPTKEQDK